MHFNFDNPILEAFDLIEKLEESPSGQYQVINGLGLPTSIKNKLWDEASKEYHKQYYALEDRLKATEWEEPAEEEGAYYLKSTTVVEEETDRFKGEGELSGISSTPYYDRDPWDSTIYVNYIVRIFDKQANTYLDSYSRTDSDAKAFETKIKEATKEALLKIAREYLPNAEATFYAARYIKLSFIKDRNEASKKYDELVANYKLTDAEIEAEEKRISDEIMSYYASKKPGEYVGD